jgi:hypothetical protein
MCCIQILTAYDPQKALANLPKPLLTSDLFSIPLGAKVQRVELTAGLHRQTRINGSVIHVDIHVASRSSKTMKKIEIQLVKATLWYPYLAAGTGGSVANPSTAKANCQRAGTQFDHQEMEDWKGLSKPLRHPYPRH